MLRNRFNRIIMNNLVWMIASLALAFWVWFVATTQANPIELRRFSNLPVQLNVSEDMLVIDPPLRPVRVTVRGQQSVIDGLTNEDIVVRADLTNLAPGTHTVPLVAEVARNTINALAETQPTQITVMLEIIEAQQKPVNLLVAEPPPTDFTYDLPVSDILQAQVSGAASAVANVVSVQGKIDLSEQRNPIDLDVRLEPVDADGNVVEDVNVEPQNARVTVSVFQRDDVRQVSIRPQILVETLPDGYVLSTISYEPQTIFVSGTPRTLANLDSTFFTSPIALTDRTSDFEVSVAIEFPDEVTPVMNGEDRVTVSVGIEELTTVRQFDEISVDIIGVANDLSATLTPDVISVVLNGPISLLDTITVNDIQVVVDLNGLGVGNHEVTPSVVVNQGELLEGEITLLPPTVTVILIPNVPTVNVTPSDTPP